MDFSRIDSPPITEEAATNSNVSEAAANSDDRVNIIRVTKIIHFSHFHTVFRMNMAKVFCTLHVHDRMVETH